MAEAVPLETQSKESLVCVFGCFYKTLCSHRKKRPQDICERRCLCVNRELMQRRAHGERLQSPVDAAASCPSFLRLMHVKQRPRDPYMCRSTRSM